PHPSATPLPYTTLFRSDVNKSGEPPRAKSIDESIEFSTAAAFVEDRKHRTGEPAEFLLRLLARLASGFVDDLQDFLPAFGWKFLDRKSTRLNSSHVQMS